LSHFNFEPALRHLPCGSLEWRAWVVTCGVELQIITWPPLASVRSWPGRAKAEFKLVAVNQSSKAGQQGKL
jgi:hypothetical protein